MAGCTAKAVVPGNWFDIKTWRARVPAPHNHVYSTFQPLIPTVGFDAPNSLAR